MMQLTKLLIFALAPAVVSGAGFIKRNSNKIDINQKVYIENNPVLGDGAGDGSLGVCKAFAPQHVSNPEAPKVRVCGNGLKMEIFVRGRCEPYTNGIGWTVGKCDTTQPPSNCDSTSPAEDARLGAAQSYKISLC